MLNKCNRNGKFYQLCLPTYQEVKQCGDLVVNCHKTFSERESGCDDVLGGRAGGGNAYGVEWRQMQKNAQGGGVRRDEGYEGANLIFRSA